MNALNVVQVHFSLVNYDHLKFPLLDHIGQDKKLLDFVVMANRELRFDVVNYDSYELVAPTSICLCLSS